MTISFWRPFISITNPILRHCNVFPTKVRLPWTCNCKCRRLLGVVIMADGFTLGPPSSLQPSTSTLQSFCCQPGLVLRGIRELPPLVMYTSTDLTYSSIADGARCKYLLVSFFTMEFPTLGEKASLLAQSDFDLLWATLSFHSLLKISTSLTI